MCRSKPSFNLVVLSFVGVKMMLGHTAWKIDPLLALAVVAGILAASIVASLVRSRRGPSSPATPSR